MERQHSYKQAIQAQPGNIREAHIINSPQVEGAGHGILKAAAALGGEFMNIVARDYNREMRGRMDDSILRVNAEFEKWKTNYKATRQGMDALTAQKDFADKYMELANQAVVDFDGNKNEIYAGELQRELAKNGLYALKEGGAYQLQQDEAWQASQWQAQLSSFKNIIDNNPNDPDMLNLEAHTLLQSWIAKNPGKDSGAVRDEIQSILANGRMNAYLARAQGGDDAALQAARTMLAGGAKGFSQNENQLRRGKTANTAGMDNEVVSLIREIAPKYNVDPELALAISKAESGGKVRAATSKAGAVGPMQLIPKWARKAGFDPYDLRQNIEGGIAEFAQLLKKYGNEKEALIAYNWGTGNWDAFKKTGKGYYGQERPAESLQYVNAVFRHTGGGISEGANSVPGLTSAQRQKYLNQIEIMQNRQKAELKADLDMQLADYFAAAKDGKADTVRIDPALVVRVHGDKAEKIFAEINDYGWLSDAIQKLKATPTSEINGLLRQMEPSGEGYASERKRRDLYQQIAQQHIAERQKNPTGYLLAANPELQASYNDMTQNWTPETVRSYLAGLDAAAGMLKMEGAPIFPAGQAQAVANMIMAHPDPGDMLETMQKAFGQAWSKAFQELTGKDGLPVAAQIVGNGLARQDAKLLMQAIKDKDFQKHFYEAHQEASFSKNDFELQVAMATEEFTSTLLAGGGQSFAVEVNRSVAALAMQYINTQGLGYADAIKKAAQAAILKNYSFQSVNGQNFRVPSAFDGDKVAAGAKKSLAEIAASPEDYFLMPLPHLGEHESWLNKTYLAKNGVWVTNNDESGLYLFIGGNVVRDKKGNPVQMTWQELQKKAARPTAPRIDPGAMQAAMEENY